MLDADKVNPQITEKYDINLQASKESDAQTQLRMRLFQCGFYLTLTIATLLISISMAMIITAVWCKNSLIDLKSFWHLPLMLLVSGTSILLVTIRSAASFGYNAKDSSDKSDSLKEQLPAIKEIINLAKSESK